MCNVLIFLIKYKNVSKTPVNTGVFVLVSCVVVSCEIVCNYLFLVCFYVCYFKFLTESMGFCIFTQNRKGK